MISKPFSPRHLLVAVEDVIGKPGMAAGRKDVA
jgi:hypothetical protein